MEILKHTLSLCRGLVERVSNFIQNYLNAMSKGVLNNTAILLLFKLPLTTILTYHITTHNYQKTKTNTKTMTKTKTPLG